MEREAKRSIPRIADGNRSKEAAGTPDFLIMELWVDEEYRDRMQSERVTAPLVGSPAGKLPPVPRDVRKAQRQAEKEKKKASKIAAKAARKGTKRKFNQI